LNIAMIGCGFVADYYIDTLANYPHLKLLGVMDRNQERAEKFSTFYSVPMYSSLEDVLSDSRIDIVLNLTNPRSHFEVSKACLEANKHVYSEKPLAMSYADAQTLVDLATERGLYLASAPCSLLGETAQTLWKALRENVIGQVRLVYAEMDDGFVHQMPYRKWVNASGTPWPYKDEFEVGCTLEHAGYYLTWFPAFFGPAQTVTAFSSCLVPDKETDEPLDVNAPDFSVACIKFESGVVVRLTCSNIAPHNHSLKVIGDKGILHIHDCWDYKSPVRITRRYNIRRKTILSPWKLKYSLSGENTSKLTQKGAQKMDFCRGVDELAAAILEQRPCRLSAQYSLHVNELVLTIQNALETGGSYVMKSSFDPIAPTDWAKT
jgi:predicted dehydrogenase